MDSMESCIEDMSYIEVKRRLLKSACHIFFTALRRSFQSWLQSHKKHNVGKREFPLAHSFENFNSHFYQVLDFVSSIQVSIGLVPSKRMVHYQGWYNKKSCNSAAQTESSSQTVWRYDLKNSSTVSFF
jgi:triacylglycerol esterase/lipase EstA (alpha/beta hydrolase family)